MNLGRYASKTCVYKNDQNHRLIASCDFGHSMISISNTISIAAI